MDKSVLIQVKVFAYAEASNHASPHQSGRPKIAGCMNPAAGWQPHPDVIVGGQTPRPYLLLQTLQTLQILPAGSRNPTIHKPATMPVSRTISLLLNIYCLAPNLTLLAHICMTLFLSSKLTATGPKHHTSPKQHLQPRATLPAQSNILPRTKAALPYGSIHNLQPAPKSSQSGP